MLRVKLRRNLKGINLHLLLRHKPLSILLLHLHGWLDWVIWISQFMLPMGEGAIFHIPALTLLSKVDTQVCFVIVVRRLVYGFFRNRVLYHSYLNFSVSKRASVAEWAGSFLRIVFAELSSIFGNLRNQRSSRLVSLMVGLGGGMVLWRILHLDYIHLVEVLAVAHLWGSFRTFHWYAGLGRSSVHLFH